MSDQCFGTVKNDMDIEQKCQALRDLQEYGCIDNDQRFIRVTDEEVNDFPNRVERFLMESGATVSEISVCNDCGMFMVINPDADECGNCLRTERAGE